jgi:hypothetical protein
VRVEDHPFVGMWADDKEKEDVAAYVRKLRQNRYVVPVAESRTRHGLK